LSAARAGAAQTATMARIRNATRGGDGRAERVDTARTSRVCGRAHRLSTLAYTPAMSIDVPEGWENREGALRRRYEFPDFAQAWAFASRVADAAEAEDHHPDIFVTWGLVELAWVTHSEGGITDRDSAMARRSDSLL